MTNALKNSIARLGNKLDEHKKDAVPMKAALDSLVPYARQARTEFNEESLGELADSIKEIGVVEPLLVRPMGNGKFEIVAGERRWRAARIAGLVEVPVLVRPMDDATADKVHLAENIHRENLSTLDLAQRVQRDLDAAGGNLATVAAKYNKGKPWVSKLSVIAQGGDSMTELVNEGVTADRAVLAAVSSLERKAPERAKALGEQLKAAPEKSNKRAITERFMKDERAAAPKAKQGRAAPAAAGKHDGKRKGGAESEPAWRVQEGIERDLGKALIVVELSPVSSFAAEFAELSKKFGKARLVVSVRHPDEGCAVVQFGNTDGHRRVYRADELRLLSVF
jgi:ParB family chromosome partitioning protein